MTSEQPAAPAEQPAAPAEQPVASVSGSFTAALTAAVEKLLSAQPDELPVPDRTKALQTLIRATVVVAKAFGVYYGSLAGWPALGDVMRSLGMPEEQCALADKKELPFDVVMALNDNLSGHPELAKLYRSFGDEFYRYAAKAEESAKS